MTNFSDTEKRVLAAVSASTLSSTGAAAGHDVRERLLAGGLDKRTIAVTLGALVDRGVLQRLRITESSGLFYTAYRRKLTST